MKNLIVMTISTVIVLGSTMAAADSKVTKSRINVNSKNKNAVSLAIGKNSLSSVGSVNIRDSKVTKSRINVNSNNKNAVSLAIGKNSTSSVGSVTIE